jgi:lipopolysaccharide biosynthesis glycosyltransferase
MNYVYVLTASADDVYYEQFFLSVASLRLHNPDAFVVVLIGKNTQNYLSGGRRGYEKHVSKIMIVDVPAEFSQKEASRWIKTSICRYITDEFLYIDCDTIIADNLDCTSFRGLNIGAVPDCHAPLRKHPYYRKFKDENIKLGFDSVFEYGNYYNGGVIYCGGTPDSRRFFERWHALWNDCRQKGNSQDMPAFNRANYELHNMISEIGGEWNCQISHNGLPFLSQAKIIHYFATSLVFMSSPFTLASEKVLSSIKENGEISPSVYAKLQNPKSAFELNSTIISDNDVLNIINSPVFSAIRRIRKRNRAIFDVLDAFVYRLTFFLRRSKSSGR